MRAILWVGWLSARCYETASQDLLAGVAGGNEVISWQRWWGNEVKPLQGLRTSPGWERKGQVVHPEQSHSEGPVLCGVKRTLVGSDWDVWTLYVKHGATQGNSMTQVMAMGAGEMKPWLHFGTRTGQLVRNLEGRLAALYPFTFIEFESCDCITYTKYIHIEI